MNTSTCESKKWIVNFPAMSPIMTLHARSCTFTIVSRKNIWSAMDKSFWVYLTLLVITSSYQNLAWRLSVSCPAPCRGWLLDLGDVYDCIVKMGMFEVHPSRASDILHPMGMIYYSSQCTSHDQSKGSTSCMCLCRSEGKSSPWPWPLSYRPKAW